MVLLLILIDVEHLKAQGCQCPGPGDVQADGKVNIVDLTGLVAYLFTGGTIPVSDPFCPSPNRGDVNCDLKTNIVDLTDLVAYMFTGGEGPCNPCDTTMPDCSLDYDQIKYVIDNFKNAVWDTGATYFDYTNVTDMDTSGQEFDEMVGDTTFTHSFRSRSHDGAVFFYDAHKETAGQDCTCKPIISDNVKTPRLVIPIDSGWVNGDLEELDTELKIDGNTVEFMGEEYEFDAYTAIDPSIADKIWDSYNNPPEVDMAEMAFWCEYQDTVNTSYFYTRQHESSSHWYEGDNYHERKVTMEVFWSHSIDFVCPEGPVIRRILFNFTVCVQEYVNGIETSYHDSNVNYQYTFPIR